MRYRTMSTSTLRVFEGILDRRGVRDLFAKQLSDVQHELLARDLEALADAHDGWPVNPAPGVN